MDICPTSGTKLVSVPAGVSKRTGKPYDAFVTCEVRGCKGPHIMGATYKRQPATGAVHSKTSMPQPPDWDNIAVGKTMSLFLQAYIASGHTFEEALDNAHVARELAELVVNYKSEIESIGESTPF